MKSTSFRRISGIDFFLKQIHFLFNWNLLICWGCEQKAAFSCLEFLNLKRYRAHQSLKRRTINYSSSLQERIGLATLKDFCNFWFLSAYGASVKAQNIEGAEEKTEVMNCSYSASLVATCWLRCLCEDAHLKKNAELVKSVQPGQLRCPFVLWEGRTKKKPWKGLHMLSNEQFLVVL